MYLLSLRLNHRLQEEITEILKDIAGHKAGQKLLQKARQIAQEDVTDAEETVTSADLKRQTLAQQDEAATAVVEGMSETAAGLRIRNTALPHEIAAAKQQRFDALDDAHLVGAELNAAMTDLGWGFASTQVDTAIRE